MNVTGGSTDVTTYFKLRKTADGLEATGLTITDFDLQYVRSGVAPVAKVDATALAATDSAHADNKAIEIDSTDQPGVYRVDWPDAAFAAGVKEVILTLKHASCFTEDLRVTIDAPVNVTKWNTTAVPSEHTAGYPIVTVKDGTGTGEINTNGGKVVGVELVDVLTTYTGNTPQTGDAYAIVNSGTHGNAALKTLIDAVDNFVDTEIATIISTLGTPAGASVSADILTIPKVLARGTAQSGTFNTIVLAASTAFADDVLNGCVVKILSGTGAGQHNVIIDYAGATDTATCALTWATNPSSDSVYEIVPASARLSTVTNSATEDRALAVTDAGLATILQVDVRQIQTGAITAASIAANAIGASELATDAVSEIAAAVWAEATRTLTAIDEDSTTIDLDATIRAAVGLASANLDTQLSDIDNYIDTEVAALVTSVGAIWTTALTEAYRTDGSTGTGAQLLYEILAHHAEVSISGTTKTTKKIDGSTTAATHTLNSSSTPTSITRAS